MKATVQVHWLATTQYVYRVTRVRDLTGEHIIVTMIRHESLVEKHYMSTFQRLASGLAFPEGPIALSDGSLLIVEMFGPYLTRIHANGRVERICAVPGGPNGIAMGPDGRVYVCNNGAAFSGVFRNNNWDLWYSDVATYVGGAIQAIDLTTCAIETLYTQSDGIPLSAPNDIVFDAHGGFYFTDLGYMHDTRKRTGIYYASPHGDAMRFVVGSESANGVGLAPDGETLYWNITPTAQVMACQLAAPGVVAHAPQQLYRFDTGCMLDSLAIDSAGNVCVAILGAGAIGVITPTGELCEYYATGSSGTTNICFGGADLRTAFVTLGGSGEVVTMRWPRAGLALAW
jgi:gluconolactonase